MTSNSIENQEFQLINHSELYENINKYKEHKFFSSVIRNINNQSLENQIITIKIINILNSESIQYDLLKEIFYNGLDFNPSLRSIVWKVLLKYLPNNIHKWEEELGNKRKMYNNLKNTSFNDKLLKGKIEKLKKEYKKEDKHLSFNDEKKNIDLKKKIKTKVNDHPLESSKDSIWNNMFNNLELYEEILTDTKRTKNYISFFTQNDLIQNVSGCEMLTNILYLYIQFHKKNYFQGTNEICATILYCFSLDENPFFRNYLESDVFFCFSNLFSEIDIWYENNYFNVPSLIKGIEKRLSKFDLGLYEYLKEVKIDFNYFLFRWISVCFCQEYELPEILRLWDSGLSYKYGFTSFLENYSIALLKLSREKIIFNELYSIIEFLQNEICSYNMEKILSYLINYINI